jgi:hypothetical protein
MRLTPILQKHRIAGPSLLRTFVAWVRMYAGAIDGVFGPDMRRALMACAVDPACWDDTEWGVFTAAG